MKVDVQTRGFTLTPPLRAAIDLEIHELRDRFGAALHEIKVRTFDVNGPRGGADKGCLLQARFAGGGVVVCSDLDEDLYRSVARAFGRLAASAESKLRRARELRRPHGREQARAYS